MNNTEAKAVNPRLSLGSNGIYEIRWSEGGRSKRKSTGTTEHLAALSKMSDFIIERTNEARAKTNPKVSDILGLYKRQHVEVNIKSVPSYSRQVDCLQALMFGLGNLSVRQLDAEVINDYVACRAVGMYGKRKAMGSSTRRELGVLVAALNHAKRCGVITGLVHIPMPKAAPPRDLWLTESEVRTLIKQSGEIGSRVHTFVVVASYTAARKDSIMRLKWEHVDFKSRVINFQDIDLPMTKKRRVPVPMSDKLAEYMLALWEARGKPGPDEYVLGNNSSIRRDFERACKMSAEATGNKKFLDVTPHTLRHTWATLAAKNRVPVFEIAGVLGDSVQTVTKVYAKHHPDHLRKAVTFMDYAS